MEPSYYYRERDNKVIKIHQGIGTFFQIVAYSTGQIFHSYSRTLESELRKEIEQANKNSKEEDRFKESTEKQFKNTMLAYYAKEKENGERVKNYYHNLNQ